MTNLLCAEWIRIRRYWFTWVVFGLMLIILALQVNGKINELNKLETEIETGLAEYNSNPLTEIQLEGNRLLKGLIEADYRYPTNIGTIANRATGSGWFLIILFTAVITGEDFSRRTLRTILSRGVGRVQFLLVRCLALWLMTGAAVLVITLLAFAIGPFIHAQVSTDPISMENLGSSLLSALRSWVTYLPFIVVTLFWTVLARNAGPAMGLGIILHTFEILLGFGIPVMMIPFLTVDPNTVELPFLFRILEFLSKILSTTLGYNADIFLNWGVPFHITAASIATVVGIEDRVILPTSQWRSTAFLVGYIILFLGWSVRILQRRDITYGS
jgi:ABC-type transport system involved in multi-copper enzyme maturation permease subunit